MPISSRTASMPGEPHRRDARESREMPRGPRPAASARGPRAWLVRAAVPLLLLLLTMLLARGGLAAAPAWVEGLAARWGAAPDAGVRALIALQLGMALLGAIVGRWSRGIAMAALGFLSFAAIAELSALVGRGAAPIAFAAPAAVLAVAGAMLPAVMRSGVPSLAGRGSAAWRAMAAIAVATAATAVAARVPLGEAIPATAAKGDDGRAFRGEVVEFTFENWAGRTLPDTGLPRHLPALTALTIEGRSVIVLYSPRCGSCHGLFRERFSATELPFRVVAVTVPPEPSALLLPSDQPDRVECPTCIDLALPTGPLWLVQPPVVVAVEDGVVRGVATRPDEVEGLLQAWRSG